MSADAMAERLSPPVTARWPGIGAVLGVALGAMLLLFGEEGRAAVAVWLDSTAYGHCFFVLPIALFLAWERRHAAAAAPWRPLPAMAALALPAALVWLVAERLGLMEGQQLVAMGCVQLLFLAALGWPLYRALSVPLLYLVFLVPFGAFLTPMLQDFTATFIRIGLDILGIANFTDGNIIEIPEGNFLVAEACAGLRFLIASIAFGVLYACMIYRSPGKRIAFIAASIIIPIVANGFRALGIVVLGHVLGSAEAASVDHVLYGWLFFSLVILLLIGAGLPFREDDVPPGIPSSSPYFSTSPSPAADSSRAPRQMALAAFLVVLFAGSAPVWVSWMERQKSGADIDLGAIVGCLPLAPAGDSAEAGQYWRFSCPISAAPIDHIVLRVARLPPHANAGALARLRHEVTGELGAEDSTTTTLEDRPEAFWQSVTTTTPDRVTAVAGWIGGAPARGGWRQRLAQARNSITSAAASPILLTIATPDDVTRISPGQLLQVRRAITGVIMRNRGFVADLVRRAAP